MVSDRVGENEGKRKKGESLWVGRRGVMGGNGVGGGGGWGAGREKRRSYEC